mmetsp:Transcript_44873/g.138913  ORF Transcript_44873/g.138913 Transcript_44873/m.138913 type:complete len:260 (+) Transcript_44873:173-952(+)
MPRFFFPVLLSTLRAASCWPSASLSLAADLSRASPVVGLASGASSDAAGAAGAGGAAAAAAGGAAAGAAAAGGGEPRGDGAGAASASARGVAAAPPRLRGGVRLLLGLLRARGLPPRRFALRLRLRLSFTSGSLAKLRDTDGRVPPSEAAFSFSFSFSFTAGLSSTGVLCKFSAVRAYQPRPSSFSEFPPLGSENLLAASCSQRFEKHRRLSQDWSISPRNAQAPRSRSSMRSKISPKIVLGNWPTRPMESGPASGPRP